MTTKARASGLAMLMVFGWLSVADAYYSPTQGRWLSRDPIGEMAFVSQEAGGMSSSDLNLLSPLLGSSEALYVFCANGPLERVDAWGLDWRNCIDTATMTISIDQHPPGDPGGVDAKIEVTLDPTCIECDCRFPKFRQWARKCVYRTDTWSNYGRGHYRSCTLWQEDNLGGDFYPGAYAALFGAMTDSPGAANAVTRRYGVMVELFTCALCTKGVLAGNVLGCRSWGMEVKQDVLGGTIHKRSWGVGTFSPIIGP